MPELIPIDQWYEPIPGTTEVRLREPTGEPYDPNGIPPWLGRVGLDYVRDNSHKIRLTCLFSMQHTAEDLGAPREFEELMETTTLLGDDISPSSQQDPSYRQRCIAAVRNKAITGFHVGIPHDPNTQQITQGVRKAAVKRFRSGIDTNRILTLAENDEMFAQEKVIKRAAAAMTLHVEHWSILQTVADFVAENDGEHHAVLCLNPLGIDLTRKAGQILGLSVDTKRIQEENWHIDIAVDAFNMSAVLARGTYDTADFRR